MTSCPVWFLDGDIECVPWCISWCISSNQQNYSMTLLESQRFFYTAVRTFLFDKSCMHRYSSIDFCHTYSGAEVVFFFTNRPAQASYIIPTYLSKSFNLSYVAVEPPVFPYLLRAFIPHIRHVEPSTVFAPF